jgi:pSer/pThr/pTyr-binding forkhead associated (FHA) protein
MKKEANMEGIILTHLSGSKANQEDVFPLSQLEDIIIGRDPWSHVLFDESETMVGRQHAKISRHPDDPSQFFITDQNSRNGTYVNQLRIFGMARLKPGDVVQCGFGGPEFRFSVEPETDRLNAPYTPAPTVNLLKHPPLESAVPNQSLVDSPGTSLAPLEQDEITIERAITPVTRKSNKGLVVGSGVFMGLIVLGAGFLLFRNFKSFSSNIVENPGLTSQPSPQPTATDGKIEPSPLPSASIEVGKDSQSPGTAVAPTGNALTATPATVRRNPAPVKRRPRVTRKRTVVMSSSDAKKEAKRLKKEREKREKEAKKNKSKY